MGGQVSTNVARQRDKINSLSQQINAVADKIVRQGELIGWDPDNRTVDCERIVYFYANELQQFSKDTLKDAAYNIGIRYEGPVQKERICKDIVEYYASKMDLIYFLQRHLYSGCRESEEIIYGNFLKQLGGATEEVKREAYTRLQAMEKEIEEWYKSLLKNIEYIANPITTAELNDTVARVYRILTAGYYKCCIAQDALRDFTWVQYFDEAGRPYYYLPYLNKTEWELPQVRELAPVRLDTETFCKGKTTEFEQSMQGRHQPVGKAAEVE